jgi:hypothetical protein
LDDTTEAATGCCALNAGEADFARLTVFVSVLEIPRRSEANGA